MKELAAEVEKNEPGCLLYQVFTNPADGSIVVIEKYVSRPIRRSEVGLWRFLTDRFSDTRTPLR
jgi:hypothetical protein